MNIPNVHWPNNAALGPKAPLDWPKEWQCERDLRVSLPVDSGSETTASFDIAALYCNIL